jgi:hypothetical protein
VFDAALSGVTDESCSVDVDVDVVAVEVLDGESGEDASGDELDDAESPDGASVSACAMPIP